MTRLYHFLIECGLFSLLVALLGTLAGSALVTLCFATIGSGLCVFPVIFEKGRSFGVRETVHAFLALQPGAALAREAEVAADHAAEREPPFETVSYRDQPDGPGRAAGESLQPLAPLPLPAAWVPDRPLVVAGELSLTLGEAVRGRGLAGLGPGPQITGRLGDMGHLLIGGAPRSGKSVLTRALLYQALLSNLERAGSGDTVHVGGIDLTGVTLNPVLFEGLPQLFAPIATTREEADALLERIEAEAKRREDRFRAVPSLPEKLAEYLEATGERLPYLIIFIEEFGALSLLMGREWQDRFTSLVWRVAKYGFHFVCLSQDLTKATVGPSRDAFMARIWFRTIPASTRQMLGFSDRAGVSANVPGRGWLKLAETEQEFQGLFVAKSQLIELVKLLKERESHA